MNAAEALVVQDTLLCVTLGAFYPTLHSNVSCKSGGSRWNGGQGWSRLCADS